MRKRFKFAGHPGTPIMVFFLLLGAVAAGWVGVIGMAVIFGPVYILGAYERGKM